MAASPTARTLQHCRDKGVLCEVVEQFVNFPPPGHRKDLFGIIDMIACVPGGGILAIQATSASGVSARLKKAKAEPRLKVWLESGGGFEVWGWGKKNGRVTLRREVLTVSDLEIDTDADCF
tara:strand:+ start:5819 stop:6181 length:363 start_codon:yes stop_codon:yes gene_type:complete